MAYIDAQVQVPSVCAGESQAGNPTGSALVNLNLQM